MPNTEITTIIAIYGAVLATGTAIWSVYTYWKSQPALIVTGQLTRYSIGLGESEAICIEVTNKGQRPMTVTTLGYISSATRDRLLPLSPDAFPNKDSLPKELRESQRVAVFIRREYLGAPWEVEFLYAMDSVGHIHKSKRMPLKGQKYPTVH